MKLEEVKACGDVQNSVQLVEIQFPEVENSSFTVHVSTVTFNCEKHFFTT